MITRFTLRRKNLTNRLPRRLHDQSIGVDKRTPEKRGNLPADGRFPRAAKANEHNVHAASIGQFEMGARTQRCDAGDDAALLGGSITITQS